MTDDPCDRMSGTQRWEGRRNQSSWRSRYLNQLLAQPWQLLLFSGVRQTTRYFEVSDGGGENFLESRSIVSALRHLCD